MKKLLFLINPLSGKTEGRNIHEKLVSILSHHLPRHGYDIVKTEPDIKKQLKDMAEGYETVVAVGGDGTISSVIHTLITLERTSPIGVIPIGTGNDLARSLGLLAIKDLESLVRVVLKRKTEKVDVLTVNNHYVCVNYMGFGNDARILSDFEKIRRNPANHHLFKGSMGKAVYAFAAIWSLTHKIPRGAELSFVTQKKERQKRVLDTRVRGILISNINSYGGGTIPSSRSRTDDGLFEVTVVRSMKEWAVLHLARVFKKPVNVLCPGMLQFQAMQADISLPAPAFCQVDGEIIGALSETKKTISIRMHSPVEMVVP